MMILRGLHPLPEASAGMEAAGGRREGKQHPGKQVHGKLYLTANPL